MKDAQPLGFNQQNSKESQKLQPSASIGRMGWNPLLRILLRVTNPNPERVPAATTALLCRDGSGLLGFSFKSRTGVGSDLLPSYWHKSVL